MVLTKPAPWVLLRGLTREAGHWGHFVPLLREAVAPHRVLTPDLPGNGTRWAERSAATVPALMEAVRADLAAQGIHPPYRLLGMSLGAMACVAWAEMYADEVEAMVLVNTSLRPFSGFHQRLLPRAWLPLARLLTLGAAPDAMEQAVGREGPPDDGSLVFHDDQGAQYTSRSFQRCLDSHGIVQSVSRPGTPLDNAVAESFFKTLKRELVKERSYGTRDEAKQDIFKYIELYYNRVRMHSTLGYMSPVEYERQYA